VERRARYMTRAPFARTRGFEQKDGRVKRPMPPNPKIGQDHRLFEPLEWVHAVTTQIPDARQHLVRYQGAYAIAARSLYRPAVGEEPDGEEETAVPAEEEDSVSAWQAERRRS